MKRALFETLGLFFTTAVLAQFDGAQIAILRVIVLAFGSIFVIAPILNAVTHDWTRTSPSNSRPHASRTRRI